MQPENSPLISIIIPAYNTSEYIHRAIGSSLRQTHKNVEVIVVDDGSTDDTLKVAQYFAGTDSRIRVLTQKNAGVSAARNHAIREAKGNILYFWILMTGLKMTRLKLSSMHRKSIRTA